MNISMSFVRSLTPSLSTQNTVGVYRRLNYSFPFILAFLYYTIRPPQPHNEHMYHLVNFFFQYGDPLDQVLIPAGKSINNNNNNNNNKIAVCLSVCRSSVIRAELRRAEVGLWVRVLANFFEICRFRLHVRENRPHSRHGHSHGRKCVLQRPSVMCEVQTSFRMQEIPSPW